MTALLTRLEPRGAPQFPGATLEIDATGQIVYAWLGSAAPEIDARGDVLAALDIDDTTPDAARVQMLLACTTGAAAAAWPIFGADAPATLTRRDGHALAVLWEPIIEDGAISGVAMFVLPASAPAVEPEDPVETNRICVDALALLDECEASLSHLEADHSARHAVHRMFRAIHTIKGSTRGAHLQAIADLAHQTEEIIDVLRRDGEAPGDALTQLAESLRQLRAAVTAARPRGEVDDAMTELLSECRPALVELHMALTKLADGDREAAAVATRVIDLIRVASERAHMRSLQAQCATAANAVELIAFGAEFAPALIEEATILDRQIELYAAVYREVSASDAGPSLLITMASWTAPADGASGSLAGLVDAMAQAGVPSLIEAISDPDPLAKRRALALLVDAPAMFEPGRPRDDATLRTERTQLQLLGALDHLERTIPRSKLAALRAIVEHLVWVPLAGVTRRLVRMTRTLGADLGKNVVAEIELGDILVAPDIVRVVGEILIHAVRNAVDHGIEAPDERSAAGKDPRGSIHIEAYAVDDRVLVSVRDDGRGVAIERVRRIAVERGLLSASDAAAAGDPALLDLLFHPGFSTASTVTAVSGRGVGMDAIRSLAEEQGGRVALSSRSGRGSELTIDLPLTPPRPPSDSMRTSTQTIPRIARPE